eukprot:519772_1
MKYALPGSVVFASAWFTFYATFSTDFGTSALNAMFAYIVFAMSTFIMSREDQENGCFYIPGSKTKVPVFEVCHVEEPPVGEGDTPSPVLKLQWNDKEITKEKEFEMYQVRKDAKQKKWDDIVPKASEAQNPTAEPNTTEAQNATIGNDGIITYTRKEDDAAEWKNSELRVVREFGTN